MASVNSVHLLGNVGRDPDMAYTPSGMAVAKISLATSSRRKDKHSGQTIEETQWHRLVFFDKVAEVVGQYVRKGSSIYVSGSLKYGEYDGKDGIKRYTTDIICNQLQLLGERKDDGRDSQPPAPRAPATPAANNPPAARPPAGPKQGEPDWDDGIPFISSSPTHDAEPSKARRMTRTKF